MSQRLQTWQLRAAFAAALSRMYGAEVPAYTTLVEQFAAWRTNEAVVLAQLQTLAQQASTATLATIPNIQLELVQLSRTESRARPRFFRRRRS